MADKREEVRLRIAKEYDEIKNLAKEIGIEAEAAKGTFKRAATEEWGADALINTLHEFDTTIQRMAEAILKILGENENDISALTPQIRWNTYQELREWMIKDAMELAMKIQRLLKEQSLFLEVPSYELDAEEPSKVDNRIVFRFDTKKITWKYKGAKEYGESNFPLVRITITYLNPSRKEKKGRFKRTKIIETNRDNFKEALKQKPDVTCEKVLSITERELSSHAEMDQEQKRELGILASYIPEKEIKRIIEDWIETHKPLN